VAASNAEIIRRYVEGLPGLTPAELRTHVADFCDPDVDYYPARKFAEARPCHGVEQLSEFLIGYAEAWTNLRYVIQYLTEIGDDRILLITTIRAEGRESGMRLDGDLFQCLWLRHGRTFRQEDHLTLRGALRALGLEGETLEAAGLPTHAGRHPARGVPDDP
jgi:hypothetical protein